MHLHTAAQGAVDYAAGIATLRQLWAQAGREGDPDLTIFGMGPDRDRVAELVGLGFNRVVFGLPAAGADKVLPMLDRYAEIGHAINAE